ncbi:nucleobase:cation symporter-2 family protein [Sphingobium sp. Ant17]|uniref:nucleobase:cation symporter-2 family protein n=1 Tax=Sphingobium sp. Ant17 TaxID=1461752 RepID=UPI000450E27B|nr:nucleobase:cation symporter-2 family protein [Sphingobium sp. Ant17]EXS71227.1 purine permease [Sphingobium sp. Ant17]
MSSNRAEVHPVDSVPQVGALGALALQHVLTMYAGAITVPLLVASALHLSSENTAYLVSADLFACGLVTLLQSLGVGAFGIRLPIIMGVTFVGVMPSIAIANQPGMGLPAVYGAAIAAGLIVIPLVPLIGRLRSVLTPTVTGTAMLLIGLSLMGIAVDWSAGGQGAKDYGSPTHLLLASVTVGIILLVTRFGVGFLANCAILIGMASGYILAAAMGLVDLTDATAAPALQLITPFHFGMPIFDLGAIASMVVVLLVTLVESSGMLTMLGDIVDRPVTTRDLSRGLRADCMGAVIGGLFNSFPYTSYAQNIALVSMTGVRSRFVCAGAAVILLILALFPKLSAVVAAVPPSVLGGAALVLFGMVAASGIRSLAAAGLDHSREDLLVVAISLGVGLIPTFSDRFFASAPPALAPFTHSGVLLGIVTAIALNLFLRAGRNRNESDADQRDTDIRGLPTATSGTIGG